MISLDSSSQRLVLRSGSTTIILDKANNAATLQRKFLFWTRKPVERQLPSVTQARVNTDIDPRRPRPRCAA